MGKTVDETRGKDPRKEEKIMKICLDLTLFDGAEGAEETGGAEAVGAETEGSEAQVDRAADFERLINEQYRDLYDERMQKAVNSRIKSLKGIEGKFRAEQEKVKSYEPILQMLSERYGSDDLAVLAQKLGEDDAYLNEEADRLGISKEQLVYTRKLERERDIYAKRDEERRQQEEFRKKVAGWQEQAEEAKAIYPNIDFQAEVQNEEMFGLLNSGVDFKTAYQVVHMDDLMSGAMQYTAEKVKEKVVKDIQARGARPQENGSSGAAVTTKTDVSKMTKAQRDDIARRVMSGERIVL